MNRPSLATLCGYRNLIGCEIGVSRGINALEMLQELSIDRLYLVDPYERRVSQRTIPGVFRFDGEALDAEREAHRRLAIRMREIIWIKKRAEDLDASDFSGLLDFIYIDGEHTFSSVRATLGKVYRCVRDGGLVAGHDYGHGVEGGVKEAVDEFVSSRPVALKVGRDGGGERFDWWFTKPRKGSV